MIEELKRKLELVSDANDKDSDPFKDGCAVGERGEHARIKPLIDQMIRVCEAARGIEPVGIIPMARVFKLQDELTALAELVRE